MSIDKIIVNIRETILSNIPREAGITKIEFEGPKIAIYSVNPLILLERGDDLIKNIVKTLKKRVVIRADPEVRMNEVEAKKVIAEIVPPEAEITGMYFDHNTGEVEIEAKRPGYVIGKEGQTLKQIITKTLWRPRVVRTPPLKSRTVEQVRELFRSKSEERIRFLRDVGTRIHRSIFFKDSRVRVVALGGFQEVGRSAILVQTPESNILLDVGIKPAYPTDEYPFLDLLDFDIDYLDAVVITHAHLDHCGFLPFLFKYGYRGPVYTTEPTMYLMKLLYDDYLEVGVKEGKIVPYDRRSIAEAITHTIPLKYGEVTDITPDVRLTLHDAGHILGSAIVHLHIGRGLFNIVYTGDFKFERTRLLNCADYKFPRVEALIMESTYGSANDIMPPRYETEKEFISMINKTLERGGKVLVPVLAVGRAQEIMMVINEGIRSKKLLETVVYLEGMIQEATAIHTTFPEYLSQSVKERIYRGENPFTSDEFVIVDNPSKREEALEVGPCIIMATSGMLIGGPVIEYLKTLAPDEKNSLIFVSYQIEGTLGSRILRGLREVFLHEVGSNKMRLIKINMDVYNIQGFSGHSDRRQLVNYLRRITPRPEKVILCHGEKSKIRDLGNYIRKRLGLTTIDMSNTDAVRIK